jgi:uncharacterized protein YciI
MSPDEAMTRLGAHMARLKGVGLWALFMTPTETWPAPPDPGSLPAPEMIERFVEHLDWLEAQERAGVLVLSGTLDQELGIGPGMAIIRASSREEAEAIAETEPFHRYGIRQNTVRSWTVNEGSLTLKVKLFTNEIAFE